MRELDLHGLTWRQALEEFEAESRRALEHSGGVPTKIRLIHGYGSHGQGGVLRDRLRAFCDGFGDYLEYERGEDIDGNKGVTDILVLKPFPDALERLAHRILAYCRNGRTMSEIEGKFRRSGAPMAMDAVATLRRQGHLERTRNKRGTYGLRGAVTCWPC